jgi:PII-like signaling protein
VNADGLKLTVYFGEHDRVGDRHAADALADVIGEHALRAAVTLRGASGFRSRHAWHTDRLLTRSEVLPVVAVAVDTRPRITAALEDVRRLGLDGLVTLERARLLTAPVAGGPPPGRPGEAARLTVYAGRQERAGARPAYEAVVAALQRHGVAGATVLLGVDGTLHGARRRARLLGRNADVPLMVVSVAEADRIARALPDLDAMLGEPLATWERVTICKRDGQRLAEPSHPPATDASGLPMWQKVMVYVSEQARHDGRPLSAELMRRLRDARAAGATSVRGIWGFHGEHAPHGDLLWQLRRRVPVVTVAVDTPENVRRWFGIVDELTERTGLVTSELVPVSTVERVPGEAEG